MVGADQYFKLASKPKVINNINLIEINVDHMKCGPLLYICIKKAIL